MLFNLVRSPIPEYITRNKNIDLSLKFPHLTNSKRQDDIEFPALKSFTKLFYGHETDPIRTIPVYFHYVYKKYPYLLSLNQANKGIKYQVKTELFPRFFVIKSFTEEDIHKVVDLT